MANVNSISKNSDLTSLYGSRNVLSGLASGLDTEAMIENSVKSYQTKIKSLEQDQTMAEWKQEAYREVTDAAVDVMNKYTSYTAQTNLGSVTFYTDNAKAEVTGAHTDALKVNSATKLTDTIEVLEATTATQATITMTQNSGDFLSQFIRGNEQSGYYLDRDAKLGDVLGVSSSVVNTLKISLSSVTYERDSDGNQTNATVTEPADTVVSMKSWVKNADNSVTEPTLGDWLDAVRSKRVDGLDYSFSSVTGTLQFFATEAGAGQQISITSAPVLNDYNTTTMDSSLASISDALGLGWFNADGTGNLVSVNGSALQTNIDGNSTISDLMNAVKNTPAISSAYTISDSGIGYSETWNKAATIYTSDSASTDASGVAFSTLYSNAKTLADEDTRASFNEAVVDTEYYQNQVKNYRQNYSTVYRNLQNEITSLTSTYNSDFAAAQKRAAEGRSEFTSQISRAEDAVRTTNSTYLNTLDGYVTELAKSNINYDATNNGLVSSMGTTQTSIDTYTNAIAVNQGLITSANNTISTNTETINGLNGQISGYNTQISGLNGQISGLNGQIEDLQEQMNALSEDDPQRGVLSSQIEELNGQIADLNGQIEGHRATIAGLNSQIVGYREANENLTGQIQTWTAEKDGWNTILADLNQTMTNLETQQNALNRSLAEEKGRLGYTDLNSAQKSALDTIVASNRDTTTFTSSSGARTTLSAIRNDLIAIHYNTVEDLPDGADKTSLRNQKAVIDEKQAILDGYLADLTDTSVDEELGITSRVNSLKNTMYTSNNATYRNIRTSLLRDGKYTQYTASDISMDRLGDRLGKDFTGMYTDGTKGNRVALAGSTLGEVALYINQFPKDEVGYNVKMTGNTITDGTVTNETYRSTDSQIVLMGKNGRTVTLGEIYEKVIQGASSQQEAADSNRINITVRGRDASVKIRVGSGEDAQEQTLYAGHVDDPSNTSETKYSFNGNKLTVTNLNGKNVDLNIDVKKSFSAGSDADAAKIQWKTDYSTQVSAVKSFVDDMNALLKKLHEGYKTQPLTKSDGSSYKPLTEEDEEDLSESAIEKYEAKAKTGLLYGDSDLNRMYNELISIFTESTGKYETVTENGKTVRQMAGTNMGRLGITMKLESDGSMSLQLDEDKLKDALEEDGNAVKKVFVGDGGSEGLLSNTSGSVRSIRRTVNAYASTSSASPGIFVKKSGATASSSSLKQNTMKTQIAKIQEQIASWRSKMQNKVDFYTKQFTMLETLMSKMNNQSSMLSGLTGG